MLLPRCLCDDIFVQSPAKSVLFVPAPTGSEISDVMAPGECSHPGHEAERLYSEGVMWRCHTREPISWVRVIDTDRLGRCVAADAMSLPLDFAGTSTSGVQWAAVHRCRCVAGLA